MSIFFERFLDYYKSKAYWRGATGDKMAGMIPVYINPTSREFMDLLKEQRLAKVSGEVTEKELRGFVDVKNGDVFVFPKMFLHAETYEASADLRKRPLVVIYLESSGKIRMKGVKRGNYSAGKTPDEYESELRTKVEKFHPGMKYKWK